MTQWQKEAAVFVAACAVLGAVVSAAVQVLAGTTGVWCMLAGMLLSGGVRAAGTSLRKRRPEGE